MTRKQPAVYVLASKPRGTLYIGVTTDLPRRVWEHKSALVDGFTKEHATYLLVYYELHDDIRSAIEREKRLKKWYRLWKLRLIEERNPEWRDLWDEIL